MFELKKGTANLEGTCYFEFVKNLDKLKTCWNQNAYYIDKSAQIDRLADVLNEYDISDRANQNLINSKSKFLIHLLPA